MRIERAEQILLNVLDRPIAYHRVFRKITGSTVAAIFLSQCWYWKSRGQFGDGWFYKTQAEWEEEIGLSRKEQETARRVLRELGFLKEEKRGLPSKIFFYVDSLAVTTAMVEASKPNEIQVAQIGHSTLEASKPNEIQVAQIGHHVMSESGISYCPDRASSDAQMGQAILYTENTTENTHRLVSENSKILEKEGIEPKTKPSEKFTTLVKDLDDPHPSSAPPLPRESAQNESLTRSIATLYERCKPNGWVANPTITTDLESQIMRAMRSMPDPESLMERVELALRFAASDFALKQRVGTLADLFKFENLVEWSDKGRSRFGLNQSPQRVEDDLERRQKFDRERERIIEYARLKEAAGDDWMRENYSSNIPLGRRLWACMKEPAVRAVVAGYREKLIALGVPVNV